MSKKLTRIAVSILILSLLTLIVGYFLWTILIPIQDFSTLSSAEVRAAQQEFALNYPLGRFLLYLGSFGFITSVGYLVQGKMRNQRDK